ncbi:MAG: hypothetical protein GF335_04600 [Candidatus Moranbacteria bacterium]|nr:hypothetical protein [Candidatus Moranbacteria bacterium]
MTLLKKTEITTPEDINPGEAKILLPPSPADLDIHLPGWSKHNALTELFEKHNLDPRIFQQGVIGPRGIWIYKKIELDELPPNSQLVQYLEEKKKIQNSWEKLLKNKLLPKIKNTKTDKLKEFLSPYLSKNFQNILSNPNTERKSIEHLFEVTLNHSQKLIESFVDQEDIDLALKHKIIKDKNREIELNTKKAYDKIYKKNFSTEKATENDIQNFIKALYWKQIALSFVPHSQDLIKKAK